MLLMGRNHQTPAEKMVLEMWWWLEGEKGGQQDGVRD